MTKLWIPEDGKRSATRQPIRQDYPSPGPAPKPPIKSDKDWPDLPPDIFG